MKKCVLGLLIVLLVAAVPASADNKGFFVGGGLGKSNLEVSDFFPELVNLRGSENGFGFKLFGGYRFFEFLAVEAGYTDLGTQETWETSHLMFRHRVKVGVTGWNASAIGFLPLGSVDLFAKVGVMSWDANIAIGLVGSDEKESLSGTDMTFGLGIGFNFKHLFVRGEGEWYQIGDVDNVLMVSISLGYSF
jgi:hypothetical protein